MAIDLTEMTTDRATGQRIGATQKEKIVGHLKVPISTQPKQYPSKFVSVPVSGHDEA